MPSNMRTGGIGCVVAVGDFAYLFGTGIVRRLNLKGLGPNNNAASAADVTQNWANLGSMPVTNVLRYCAPLPTNRNKIIVLVYSADMTAPNAIIFDIITNAFTTVASTTATVNFGSGSPLIELCHGDQTLYAFPFGTGAKKFVADGSTEAAIWPDVMSAGALAVSRINPAVAVVAEDFFASPPFSDCTGC